MLVLNDLLGQKLGITYNYIDLRLDVVQFIKNNPNMPFIQLYQSILQINNTTLKDFTGDHLKFHYINDYIYFPDATELFIRATAVFLKINIVVTSLDANSPNGIYNKFYVYQSCDDNSHINDNFIYLCHYSSHLQSLRFCDRNYNPVLY